MSTAPREIPDTHADPTPARLPPRSLWAAPRRPLANLVFLLPVLLFYEWQAQLGGAGAAPAEFAAARSLLSQFLAWCGPATSWMPALLIPLTLLGWHVQSREPWRVPWLAPLLMIAESLLLAVPLAVLGRVLADAPLLVRADGRVPTELVATLGAAIYEEFIFRLVLIALLSAIAVRVLNVPRTYAIPLAWCAAAALFALAHVAPVGSEPLSAPNLAARFLGGVYLGAVLHLRGLGVATGAHALANGAILRLAAG